MVNFKKISASDWLNIINNEADPSIDAYHLVHYQIDDLFAVHLKTGYASMTTPLVATQEEALAEADKLITQYENSITKFATLQPLKYTHPIPSPI
jgi:hypothetical protein